MTDRDIHLARALLIEGNALLRSVTAQQLRDLGVGQVSQCSRLADARLQLEREHFDIVLCNRDFEGSATSGQDLLEELRREQILSHSTVFIMLASQAAYHQVVEAGEASLDGLLVRPFTAAALGERVMEARNRKRALSDVLKSLDAGDFETAFARAIQRFQNQAPYAAFCGRLAAELLLRMNRATDSRHLFERLAGLHDNATWALLGVARAQLAAGDVPGARKALAALIKEQPDCADAYDLMARTLVDQTDFDGALDAYRRAAAYTPGCILRAQHVGALAFYQGHPAEAMAALERAVGLGTKSKLFDAQSLMLLALLRHDQGLLHGVNSMGEQLARYAERFPKSARLRRMGQAVKVLSLLLSDRRPAALDAARELAAEADAPGFDLEAALILIALWARLPAPVRPPGEHDALLEKLAARFCVAKAIAEVMCATALREPAALSTIKRQQARILELAEASMALSLQGDHGGAVEKLLAAGEETRNAKLLEMGAALLRRHAASIVEADALAARVGGLLRRWCSHMSHVAGVHRTGRSPGGLQIRTAKPSGPPTPGTAAPATADAA